MKMTRRNGFLFACFFILALPAVFCQQAYVDSLRRVFLAEKDPVKKIDLFYEIANEQALDNPKLGFAYADSLEFMAKKAGYKKGIAMSKHLRGFAFDDQGEYEKALALFREELAIFIEIQEKDEISTAYTNLGSVWGNLGRTDSSVAYYLKSLAIDEEMGDSLGASIIHNNIGNIYSDDGAYDKAIEHFEKALKIRQMMGAEKRYVQCYSNLATVYSRKKDYVKSEEYALKGLAFADKYDNKAYAGIICNSLGTNFNDQKQFNEALPWLEKALSYWKSIGNEAYQTYALYNLAIAYAGLGDGGKALQAARAGFAIVEKLKLEHQYELYFKAFATAYEAQGNYAQALDWHKKYVVLVDSILKLDNTKKVAQMEAQFETQKKEAQIARQQLELERQSSQKRNILIGGIALLLALGGGFQYFRNKQKIKQKEAELLAQKAELDAQIEHAEAEKLREMDSLKSTFFANISHEFRTPLTLIVSPLEQMLDGSFRGDFQKYYRIMHRNGKRLLELVNQLLDLSKLESGKMKLQPAPGDLAGFIRAIAYSFESLAVRKGIDFQVQVPPPPAAGFFDKDKLEKILTNLLSNAFKFTGEEGKVSLDCQFTLELDSPGVKSVELKISDTGVGIPAEQLPQIFERFTQSGASEIQPGSGIGLALTKELAELHGGKIEVRSAEGEGTTFLVTLATSAAFFKHEEIEAAMLPSPPNPLKGEQTQPEAKQFVEQFFETPPASGSPFRGLGGGVREALAATEKPLVLIVEDNADVRSYVADTLAGNYQILEAENGKLGLEKAIETTPDLVISDIMMPEMDGTELCKALKTNEKTSHVPVVLLTAKAEQSDKLQGLRTGADDYLVKPFDASELQVRVANLIEQRRKLQAHFRKSLRPFSPAEPVEAESMDAAFLQRVREAVDANLDDENFSVVELGERVSMSRSQLHRKLKSLTGYSPNEVIRNMRLERAKALLERRAGTASEIAFLTGFSSPAYFAKCFKDYFGVTPSEI